MAGYFAIQSLNHQQQTDQNTFSFDTPAPDCCAPPVTAQPVPPQPVQPVRNTWLHFSCGGSTQCQSAIGYSYGT